MSAQMKAVTHPITVHSRRTSECLPLRSRFRPSVVARLSIDGNELFDEPGREAMVFVNLRNHRNRVGYSDLFFHGGNFLYFCLNDGSACQSEHKGIENYEVTVVRSIADLKRSLS